MDLFFRLNLSFLRCKPTRRVLASFWAAGLLLGALAAISADDLLASTMRTAVSGGMSISGLLSALLLPLLFSAFAVYVSKPLLLPVVFLKAFLFAYTGAGILAAFGSAGWLIACLLMFSDALMLPLLWCFWLRSVSQPRRELLRSGAFCLAGAALIGCFDYCLVAPFLASLIN